MQIPWSQLRLLDEASSSSTELFKRLGICPKGGEIEFESRAPIGEVCNLTSITDLDVQVEGQVVVRTCVQVLSMNFKNMKLS